MKRFNLEFAVGIFVIIGIASLAYLSIRLGKLDILGARGYDVSAVFSNVGGLSTGASVEIAGVTIGRVTDVALVDYEAKVQMNLASNVEIQDDAIAAIRTKGLIGEKFVEITPGGAEKLIPPGGTIRNTTPAVNLEQIISSFVFGKI